MRDILRHQQNFPIAALVDLSPNKMLLLFLERIRFELLSHIDFSVENTS
jgi:hypothetical protein